MFFETTKLQEDDLLDDGADCVIALPPTRASSGFQATLLQIVVMFTAPIFNQNSLCQFKYVSQSRNKVHCSADTFRIVNLSQ